jgi:hypothetical protein
MRACGSCGAEVREEDVFCGVCGDRLSSSASPAGGEEVVAPTAVVVTNRRPYEREAEHLDPLGSRFAAAAARQAGVFTALAAFATALVVLLNGNSGSNRSSLVGLIWIGAFFAYLLLRVPVSLSEWKTLVEDKGPQAQEVFGHVGHVLRRRQVPVNSIRVRGLSQPRQPRHDYLEVRHGILTGYVTCFPYGTDLYIGWTLWWRFSPLHYVLMAAGRRWQIFTVRGSELHLLYRYDIAKAMREALHAAVGEAVDAVRGLRALAPLPEDVPVETIVVPEQRWDPALAPQTGA